MRNLMNYTQREIEVLRYISDGMATREIATVMDLNPHTVSNYTANLYSKTGARNREELYKIACVEAEAERGQHDG